MSSENIRSCPIKQKQSLSNFSFVSANSEKSYLLFNLSTYLAYLIIILNSKIIFKTNIYLHLNLNYFTYLNHGKKFFIHRLFCDNRIRLRFLVKGKIPKNKEKHNNSVWKWKTRGKPFFCGGGGGGWGLIEWGLG